MIAADLEILAREQIGMIRPCNISGSTHEQDDDNDTDGRILFAHFQEIRIRDGKRHVDHVRETSDITLRTR